MKNHAARSLAPFRNFIAIGLMLVAGAFPVCAQQAASNPSYASDLAAQNLNRVAASAAQIEGVLRKDPGLLVELKRWVAKEATDRGQIVQDGDLSDQAIFNRLRDDSEFRAVATRLLQRYGHLLPQFNPGSEPAQENELARQERLRQLAKAQAEEEAEASRERPARRDVSGAAKRALEQSRQPLPPAPPPGELSAPGVLQRAESLVVPRNPVEESAIRSRQLTGTGSASDSGTTARLLEAATSPTLAGSAYVPSSAELEMNPFRRGRRISPSGRSETETATPIIARANPFADIPSLYDLYRQVSPRPPDLARFGEDVFRGGVRDSELLPMDLPVGPDYVVGPGDGLAIDLWGGVSQRLMRTVDRDGRVSLPEVGPILVSGRSLAEVQQIVQHVLRTQFRDVSADVTLARLRTIRVFVVGDVEQPGTYDISSLSTPLNALFVAGGPANRGSLRVVRHFRGKQLVQEVDLYDLLLRGVRSDLRRLENGDTVLVPPIGPQVTIEGAVRRPAIYELRSEKSLAELLELSGGILPTATLRKIQVQRVEAHEKRTMLSLDIAGAKDAEAARKQLEDFTLQDEDEIRIFPIAPYNLDAVYLQGHVLRPGRYSFRSGMRLTDLVVSYSDLLPEPATKYAEIVRLNPPDFRPSVESFDLGAAFSNPAAAPTLQPLDTVRVFSRYDFEYAPIVWVGGEVRNPGAYRTSGQIHLGDAIHLAGGLTPDALTENVQVFRTLPDSKLKILSINLAQALAGNPLENILLQPRDRIIVHRNPAKVDPPSVYVRGEVDKPGRYPLTTNLRVGDLIRLAGGLKRSAYTEQADLTRFLSADGLTQVNEQREISITKALEGAADHDLLLRDSDTLAIRQLPGWNDIGASLTVRGEVQHPGTYGIRTGERLSSLLRRAGGFLPSAYPRAALLERVEVRNFQEKSRQALIERIEQQEAATVKVSMSATAQEQRELQQAAIQQRERVLAALRQAPISGRLVIKLYKNLAAFENSPDDIELRNGDTLFIPKRPDFVIVTGQVYNSNAITHEPRKNAAWYLRRAGGPTDLAEKKAIFIVRANGAVVSGGEHGWWSGSVLSAQVEAGDIIVVPEKPIGGSTFWKNLLSVAQLAASAAIATRIALP